MSKPLQVRCPICRRSGEWFEGAFGPFCSKRCRLVDLGKWLSEEHAISEPLKPVHFSGFGDLPEHADLDRPSET